MKIHAIQTGTVQVKTRQREGMGQGMGRLVNTLRDPEWTPPLPIFAWAIEHPEGVIVVDTGETSRTMEPNYFPRWHPYYRFGVRMQVEPDDEIDSQLQKIGLAAGDVRWVVMTHLHTDHAGGLHHFPKAEILVSRAEYAATQGFGGGMSGYLTHQFPAWFSPTLIDFKSSSYGAFEAHFTLTKASDVLLVPTFGHSAGHLSIILKHDDVTYFFAGDTSYTEGYLLRQVVDGVSPRAADAQDTLQRILGQIQTEPTVYLPSHDPESAKRLAAKQATRI